MASLFSQDDGNEIQVLSAAGFYGFSVTDGIFIVLLQPVGPNLMIAFHLSDLQDLGTPAI